MATHRPSASSDSQATACACAEFPGMPIRNRYKLKSLNDSLTSETFLKN